MKRLTVAAFLLFLLQLGLAHAEGPSEKKPKTPDTVTQTEPTQAPETNPTPFESQK